MTTLFISDLHLYHQRPAVTEAFRTFLRNEATNAEALYLLGDLFEVWIGDDDPDPHNRSIVAALRRLTDTGTPCYFICGNRDFLVGKRFADESGVRLLSDGTTIELYGNRILLMHGDTLCTDDVGYQRFRRIARNPVSQALFLALPPALRRRLARQARNQSMSNRIQSPEEIVDVNQSAVERTMREHDVRLLLHGHTHRPGVHRFDLGGTTVERIVLGDWYTQGSVLRWNADGPELTAFTYG